MIVEICANSFESALAAEKGGAHRIELCTQLAFGGLTPSHQLIKKVIAQLNIPVHVLIRPRKGSFYYTEFELNKMISTINFCKNTGCQGVVSGVLTSGNRINISATKQLINAAKGMDFTFHRAFDCTENAIESLEQLIDLKIKRVLSSGQKQTAYNGLSLLKEMNKLSNGKLKLCQEVVLIQKTHSVLKTKVFLVYIYPQRFKKKKILLHSLREEPKVFQI